MCYRHNLTGPEDGPRATWAEGDHLCERIKGQDGHVSSKNSLNIVS
jgi:hypothetical protein